jgi:hypothetical protein
MATNEFRWGVKPTIPGHWQSAEPHEEFEIQIAGDWIEARVVDNGKQDSQRYRAEEIIMRLVRYISLRERKRFAAIFSSVSRFDSASNRRDVTVLVSGAGCVISAGHVDVGVRSADGTVLRDSRNERMLEMRRFVATKEDENVKRMSEYLLDYYADPEKKLAALFDIIELATKIFGHEHTTARALQIDRQEMQDATKTMNESRIRTSRHRGKHLGRQRDVTSDEKRKCEVVAERIVGECIRLIQEGKLPQRNK